MDNTVDTPVDSGVQEGASESQVQDTSAQSESLDIGGKSYTKEELQELVGLGSKTRELETKYNTKLDRVWPEYTRTTQELSQARKMLENFQTQQQQASQGPQDQQRNEVLKTLKDLGVITREEMQGLREEMLNEYKTQEAVKGVFAEADRLSQLYNGQDGRPRFNKELVLYHADMRKIENLEEAYKDLFKEELKGWESKQVQAMKRPGPATMKPVQGSKEPSKATINDSNLKDSLREALYSGS